MVGQLLELNVEKVVKKYNKLRGDRAIYDSLNREISDFCYPNSSAFSRYVTKGEKRRRMIFDGTAERALEISAASITGLLANPATKWVGFRINDEELDKDKKIKEFCDLSQKKVLAVFNNPKNRFYDNLFQNITLQLAFGTASLFADEDKETVAKFRAEGPNNFCFTEDFSGNANKDMYFEKKYLIEQIKEKKWELPFEYANKKDDDEVSILRYICINPAYDPTSLNIEHARYLEQFIYLDAKKLAKTSYYRTFPTPIGRWGRLDGEIWGDSPARVALADIKMINVSQMSTIKAIERVNKGVWAVSSEAKFGKLDFSGDAVNVGRGSLSDGIKRLDDDRGLPITFEWQELIRAAIRSAFYIDVLQTAENVDMTATEAVIRQQEKLRGLGPKITRIQSDIIGPTADRVLQLLIERGDLIVPDALKKAGVEINVIYSSPVNQAQRAGEAQTIGQYANELGMLAQFNPGVLDNFDFDQAAQELADIRNVPTKLLIDPKKRDEARTERAKAAQTQQNLMMAQQAGDAAQSINKAQNAQTA